MPLGKMLILVLFLLLAPQSISAESKVFVESYRYNAIEADSKLTCRTVSLLEVKRLLLEKLGTYWEAKKDTLL